MRDRPRTLLCWGLAVGVSVVLGVASFLRGEVNQDEGWYLYAARLVSEGQQPYVDFAYTQGPVMAYAYASAYPLIERWGVAGGRLFTALAGVLCCVGAAWLAFRLVRGGAGKSDASPGTSAGAAAFVAFVLIGVNAYQSYFFTVVKTYALTGLLLVAGFLALSFLRRGRMALPAFLGGVLLALATGTRSSAGAVLPVVFLCLLAGDWMATVEWRRSGKVGVGRASGFWFALGAGATGLAVFLPFLLAAPRAFWFGLVEYHTGRTAGGWLPLLAYKGGFVSRLVQAYTPAFALLVGLLLWGWARVSGDLAPAGDGNAADAPDPRGAILPWRMPGLPMLGLSVLAMSGVHFLAPFPYDDYQVPVYPLFAVALAVLLAGVMSRAGGAAARWLLPLVLVLCTAASFSSPINQSWFVQGRDRVWWPLRTESSLARLQRAGRRIRDLAEPGDVLVTQDAYLAVESGLRMLPGLALGPFSYFPDWSTDEAVACRVVNREMLTDMLAVTDAPVVAVSGWSFSIRCPSVSELPAEERQELADLIESRYELVDRVSAFGQADTTLRIYRRR